MYCNIPLWLLLYSLWFRLLLLDHAHVARLDNDFRLSLHSHYVGRHWMTCYLFVGVDVAISFI